MSKIEWKKWINVAGRPLLAYALVFSQGALAAQNQKPKDEARSAQNASAQQKAAAAAPTKASAEAEESEGAGAQDKKADDPAHQGIKVHGHWIIDVKNPDGTVVTHREFENSIQATGTAALSALLVGNQLPGPWQVDLIGSPQPCVEGANTPAGFTSGSQPCVLVPSSTVVDGVPSGAAQAGAIFFNLTVTATSGQVVLSGSTAAATTTSISSVATVLSPCINSGTVASKFPNPSTFPCPALAFPIPPAFTSATLAQPVPVSAGQTIAVTVTISFS